MDAEYGLSIFFGAVLAVFSIFLVGYSFTRGHRRPSAIHESTQPEGDDPALSDIFDAIGTLELEYQLGRMSQEDFQTQFQAYRLQAATVLRDQLEEGRGDPAWVLEQEILLARDALDSVNGMLTTCADCSAAVSDSAKNCPHCGAEVVPRS